ncbi:L,D-transpeptidase catalytic domain [Bryocella elongata]|uniref:L,D-transpeptidase catalytic domain n=1 Tax=Bryocella elongata TaxID=863522 RepID=A0A1H5SE58_9BACT|nr:L,D-transpeptidase family protein [Bryocella elongata]SEF48037.1 L,D-transpeptidase catalytic domain [Bryocella elongata]
MIPHRPAQRTIARHAGLWMSFAFAFTLSLAGCARTAPGSIRQADRIVVVKSTHTMTLYAHGQPTAIYRVSLGRGTGAAKVREGDHNTPEGLYTVDSRNDHSRFHHALHLSYPNVADRATAAKLNAPPGGDIMIHGIRNGLGWLGGLQRHADWTDGCIALTDNEMDEVWATVPVGTPVEIRH